MTYRDQAIPVVFAREMLGIGHSSSASWPKLVLVRAGSRLIGLVVDTIEGAEDLVIKPLGALLAGHPLVSGTSLSINGEVISVLNPSGLERWLNIADGLGHRSGGVLSAGSVTESLAEERMAVLVVDDSISVRRGMARQLRGLGLDVHEVSDGLEALGRLRSSRFGLVRHRPGDAQARWFRLARRDQAFRQPVDDPRDRGQYPVRPGDPAARAGAGGAGPAFQAGRPPGAGAGRRATPTRGQTDEGRLKR